MRHGQRLEDGRLLVDNTLLASEARCQTAATIRHVYELSAEDESVTLVSGQAIHKALEVYARGGSAADALWAFEQFYEPFWQRALRTDTIIVMLGGDEKMASDRRSYDNVRRVLTRWFETHPRESWPFVADAASVEASFEVPLIPDEGVWYTGTPDIGKVTLTDGSVYAVDHKSTGRMTSEWRRGFRTSGQVSGYLWGLQQTRGERYTGMFINAIELSKVPTSTRKCNEHGVPYSECGPLHCQSDLFPVQRTADELERWRTNAIRLARRYVSRLEQVTKLTAEGRDVPWVLREVAQEGKLTGACAFCTHEEFCGTGQSALLLESRYTHRVWDPERRGEQADE